MPSVKNEGGTRGPAPAPVPKTLNELLSVLEGGEPPTTT